MSLVLNEEQLMLQRAAQEYFTANMPINIFRQARDSNGVVEADRDVWLAMVELGWSAVLVPEELGGLDFGIMGMGVLCVEAARHLAATPLQTSASLAVQALLLCKQTPERDQLIESLVSGDKLACLKTSSDNKFVAEAISADVLIDLSQVGAEGVYLKVFDLNNSELTRSARGLMDSRDYAEIDLGSASPTITLELLNSQDALIFLADMGSVLSAAELFGISSEVFERTIAYISEREQFGQQIGSFQAIQHRMAHAYMQLQLCKSVLYDALSALEVSRQDTSMAISHAKLMANDVSQLICTEAIQLHGGMGITDEVDIGLFYKRARVLRTANGSSSYHKLRFAELSNY